MKRYVIGVCSLFVFGTAGVAIAADRDVPPGLVVQLGADDVTLAASLSRSGSHLVEVLDTDAGRISDAQSSIRKNGFYGLASAEQVSDFKRLPYAESLVNVLIVQSGGVPAGEMFRVLTPNGTLIAGKNAGLREADLAAAGFQSVAKTENGLTARKPWPAELDGWSHPRHGSDGNAVSHDTAVGPPDRVRWVAGAMEEVEGVVTAGGRNFYGGILARDSFNGLRLWHRDLGKAQFNNAAFMLPHLAANRARPIASADYVVAVQQGHLVTLDARTGNLVKTFEGISEPKEVVLSGQILIACDEKGVAAYSVNNAAPLWRVESSGARTLAADQETVAFIQGGLDAKSNAEAVVLNISAGDRRWSCGNQPWMKKVYRTVLHGKQLAFEVSSLTDHDAGNELHIFDSSTGEQKWEKPFPPGMNHNRQARAMFVGDELWILRGGKFDTGTTNGVKHLPLEVQDLDPETGNVRSTHPAGLAHCFPPVGTANYILSGVMDFTDLTTGKYEANPITKANCSRENGWVPANGLIYTTPKHCTCWPMLRGFVALAPKETGAGGVVHKPVDQIQFVREEGPAFGRTTKAASQEPKKTDWPVYRSDRWRSSSTTASGPAKLGVLWSQQVAPTAPRPDGPIMSDWSENEFVKGPVSSPTIANGIAYIACPDAHEVVAMDAASGKIRWRFTANGRVDTPPTLTDGLCLFGTHAGWVYALQAKSGKVAWRFRAAPDDERIVAYGQVESPRPVPGTVLIINDVAYFGAGRQPFADGGILVFAVNLHTGQKRWVHRLDTIPQQGYYENSALEFDPIDILHQEDDGIALSRWIISADGTKTTVDKWNAFAKLDTGGGAVWVPRGCWTYGPRHQARFRGEAPQRPLCAFRDHIVLSSLNGSTAIFRRDFDIEHGEQFNSKWMTGWEAGQKAGKGENPFRSYRLAEKAKWNVDPFTPDSESKKPRKPGAQMKNEVYGMALAGDGRLFAVHKDGRLKAINIKDGSVLAELNVPPPLWDGLAIADHRLYLASQTGELVCIGE